MNPRLTAATAARVLRQLRADPRSIALILVVPAVLLALVHYLFENETLPPGAPRTFDRVGLIMLAVFPFVVMFLVTSVTMLRERTSGSLERLLTTPTHEADLLFGYALAFSSAAVLQSLVATAIAYRVFDLAIGGDPALVVLVAVLNAVLGVAPGLLCSAFAATEFQAVQFMPVVVVPQILLCGLFVPREQMNTVLEVISGVLPLSYSVDALLEVAGHADPTAALWTDLGVVGGFVVVSPVPASLTLRRRTR